MESNECQQCSRLLREVLDFRDHLANCHIPAIRIPAIAIQDISIQDISIHIDGRRITNLICTLSVMTTFN